MTENETTHPEVAAAQRRAFAAVMIENARRTGPAFFACVRDKALVAHLIETMVELHYRIGEGATGAELRAWDESRPRYEGSNILPSRVRARERDGKHNAKPSPRPGARPPEALAKPPRVRGEQGRLGTGAAAQSDQDLGAGAPSPVPRPRRRC